MGISTNLQSENFSIQFSRIGELMMLELDEADGVMLGVNCPAVVLLEALRTCLGLWCFRSRDLAPVPIRFSVGPNCEILTLRGATQHENAVKILIKPLFPIGEFTTGVVFSTVVHCVVGASRSSRFLVFVP